MLKSITLEVTGDQKLVCEGCEERVEHVLKILEGVAGEFCELIESSAIRGTDSAQNDTEPHD
jgi:hypothetical protein